MNNELNLIHYADKVQRFVIDDTWGACNHSFLEKGNDVFINFRITSWKPWPLGFILQPTQDTKHWTDNKIVKISLENDNYEFTEIKDFTKSAKIFRYNGHEDLRFFKHNGQDWFYSSHTDCNDDIKNTGLDFHKLNEDLTYTTEATDVKHKYNFEKNWAYIEGTDAEFVYSYNPFTIVKYNDGKVETIYEDQSFIRTTWRGSSGFHKYKDGYIGLVHLADKARCIYRHKLVFLDKNYKLKKESPVFSFANRQVEFTTSMRIVNDKVHILFSLYDCIPYVGIYSFETIDNLLDNSLPEKKINLHLRYELYNENTAGFICELLAGNSINDLIYLHDTYEELTKYFNLNENEIKLGKYQLLRLINYLHNK